ncbi:MAG: UDP-N-acetylglucosamine 2-epimerase (non-hydrolyzing) [Coriobacteriia bacterium]|jgi:UDP-N-acetylglucosamine 2-epimerase (non-hydrolysing)|nr:UDP-N-acetylglucosamine 2-epimerase (non-hydrolyzing) [Coriobacteriia bacterium]
MRLIAVVGARPNFIKVGPLIPALRDAGHEAELVHTGQHYDAIMSDVFFRDLSIPEPRWFLDVGSGTHAVQTGLAMMRLEELLVAERPDALIVVGDVNSTLAGALAAAKLHIPVVHLEAGLRSWDMSMPEEVNRLVADQLSAMHLTPTIEAGENLLRENVGGHRIHFVGNIMAESVLRHAETARARVACQRHEVEAGRYVLATVHRPENTDHPERLAALVAAFAEAPLPVLFPVHPRTRPLLAEHGVGPRTPNILLGDPVGYLDMLSLQMDAAAIVTDSGGIQEEACMLGTPCVTVRRNTERGVTVAVGANRLVQASRETIGAGLADALESSGEWVHPERWDTEVAARVVEALSGGIIAPNGCES